MARKAYIGVGGVARRIPKMYTGAYFGGSAGRTECIVSAAGFVLFTFSGRNFKKSYAGDAYCASVIVNGWLAPLLVSQTAANVSYSTDGNYTSGPHGSSGTVTFRGATWYVSADGALFQTTANPGGNVVHLNAITGVSSYSNLGEAALALLNYVNWLPAGDNIARKINKGYVGVNGIARAFLFPVRTELIVTTANKLILSVGKAASPRNFYKVNANPAICAYQKYSGVYNPGNITCNFWSPILISEDPEAVKTSVYEGTTTIGTNITYQTTIQYRGKTWYVTRELGAVYDLYGNTVLYGFNYLNELTGVSSYSSPDAGALDLLKYYYNDI